MFIIVSHFVFSSNNDKMYRGWQTPVWDDDGYFWTRKDVINEIINDSTPEHPFLFFTKDEARILARQIKLDRFSIESWNM